MGNSGNHCSFVLLAEFHIFEGAQLKYQFPQPLGVDENVLAMSMLPDGAETQLDDWTIFFLNQTPFNTISPVLALDTPEVKTIELPGEDGEGFGGTKPEMLCVLNLVRTKHDKALDRGAKVLALAICTRHPFIQIFKPFLLMALDDYFLDPSQDCLARLFDAVNSMDLSGAPILTRQEKLVMRSSERKDIFAEKFSNVPGQFSNWNQSQRPAGQHKSTNSMESYASFEEGLLLKGRDKGGDENRAKDTSKAMRDRTDAESSTTVVSSTQEPGRDSPSDSSFSLGGSAVWVNEDNSSDLSAAPGGSGGIKDQSGDSASVSSNGGSHTMAASSRKRSSTDASSSSSHAHSQNQFRYTSNPNLYQPGLVKDTHFYHTVVAYKDHQLPMKVPLGTFPEEVGDYSLIKLVKLFSSPNQVSGPVHPHLHTNGPQTHPIIILFNALVTGKRVIFLGHKQPAGEVSSFVLSACALASGCGAVLRGFVERAFPYANLKNRDDWEAIPAYVAGVTNPIFESSRAWDVLLDISNGSVKVANDIHITYPPTPNPIFNGIPLLSRTGTLKAEGSIGADDDVGRVNPKDGSKSDFAAKAVDNNTDRIFIEDIKTAIEDHYSESLVRLRFTEYAMRFVRLAARFEEEVSGSTRLNFSTAPFADSTGGRPPQLGSGISFADESTCLRELHSNAPRIEAWRKTNTYKYCAMDFAKVQANNNAIKGTDISHQFFRLRHAKFITDAEVLAITRTLADNVKNYEQVVELLAYLMPHAGGLMHLGFGLFHQREAVRDATVDLFNQLRQYPVGVSFLQALNHFQRYAYVRQAHTREKKLRDAPQHGQSQSPQQDLTPPHQHQQLNASRSHSNSVGKGHSLVGDRANGVP